MTDHQQDAGPVDVPAPEASTADRLRAALIDTPSEDAEAAPEGEIPEEPAESDELDIGDFEDEGEPDGEQETAIDAPASLNAEERETYGQLPPEAQAFVTALEARRNADVTKVTTKSAEAQRAAEAQAAQAAIQAKRDYAAQLNEIAKAIAPQEPQRQSYASDVDYLVAMRQHDQLIAQHSEFVQQVQRVGQEAEAEDQRAFVEARDKALMQIPEIANAETRQDYLDRVFDPDLVGALGYERSELAKIADADDVKRLNTIAGWREKAEKYDAAMKRKMQTVRSAKKRNTKPTPAQQSSRDAALREAIQRQKATGGKEGTREALRAALL